MSPAYDLLNTTIAMSNPKEEIALPLKGKKNHVTKKDFLSYLAVERLQLNQVIIDDVVKEFRLKIPNWFQLIDNSFLSHAMKGKYQNLIQARSRLLFD